MDIKTKKQCQEWRHYVTISSLHLCALCVPLVGFVTQKYGHEVHNIPQRTQRILD